MYLLERSFVIHCFKTKMAMLCYGHIFICSAVFHRQQKKRQAIDGRGISLRHGKSWHLHEPYMVNIKQPKTQKTKN